MSKVMVDAAGRGLPASPILFAGAALLQRLIAKRRVEREGEREEHDRDRHRRRRPSRRRRTLSLIVAAGGVELIVASAMEMRRANTTMDPHAPEEATALVSSGPFSLSRNPIYLGWVVLLAAHALWLGSARTLAPAAAFVAVMDRYQIPYEERALLERFGNAFSEYCEEVPRWLIRC